VKKARRLFWRLLAVGLLATAAWQLLSWTQPLWAFPVIERLTPNLVWRVETDRPLVALSFDDGPDPGYTPQVLELLGRHRAKATFFLIGERAARHPEIVRQIRDAGHEVGNHYFINGATLRHSDRDFVGYLDRTESATGISASPKLFRPPGGVAWPHQLRLARERGYLCVLGSAYPHDPAHPPSWYITWLVTKNLRPGTIVILHDGIPDPRRSIEALGPILAAGKDKGLQFVSIGTLLDSANSSSRQPRHAQLDLPRQRPAKR
jgi:peptidoglycan/xylan/chitin deacetylase (PgdA/CDA1 family)